MASLEGIRSRYVPHWIVLSHSMSAVWRIATSMGVYGCIYFIFNMFKFTVEGTYVQGQGCVCVVCCVFSVWRVQNDL